MNSKKDENCDMFNTNNCITIDVCVVMSEFR